MRTLHATNGDPLVKRVIVKVFRPGNRNHSSKIYSASPGRMFTPNGIDGLLEQIAANIERAYPTEEYRLVSLGLNIFNFVHVGARGPDADR